MASTVSTPLMLSQDLAVGILGSAAFGIAAAAGYGARPMLDAAWIAPALFAGGAILATPPLYIVTALAGGKSSPLDITATTVRALAAAATVLLGLATPVAFFSVTLKTELVTALLLAAVAVVGGTAVIVAAVATAKRESSQWSGLSAVIWCAFALVLGARLIGALSPMIHFGGWR